MNFLHSTMACENYVRRVGNIEFYLQHNLIPRRRLCPQCDNEMRLIFDEIEPVFRCNGCTIEFPMRTGTPFGTRKIHLSRLAVMLVAWLNDMNLRRIASSTGHDVTTVSKAVWEFRSVIHAWWSAKCGRIGGLGHVVEIENSLQSGWPRQPGQERKWVVGGMDRTTKEWFMTTVTDSQRTMNIFDSIVGFIDEGSVVTLECREIRWIQLKRDLGHKLGKSRNSLREDSWDLAVSEFVWRSRRSTVEELFSDFASALNYYYSCQNNERIN